MATNVIGYILDAIDMAANRPLKLLHRHFVYDYMILLRLLTHKLRGLRTLLLCLKKTNLTKESGDNDSNTSVEERPESDLLQRLEYIAGAIITGYYRECCESLFEIESLEEEIDQWYTSLSKASNSPVASEVEDIFNSVLENLEDFLSLHIAYVGVVVAPVEALKVNVTFWRNFTRFATFLGIDQQQDLLANMEVLAFSAAHFTLHIFSARHYNIKVFSEAERNLRANYPHAELYSDDGESLEFDKYCLRIDALYGPHAYDTYYERIKSTVSALLLRINPLDNPHLYESYSRALENMRSLRDSYVPNLDIQGSITLLLSVLREVLQFHTGPAADLKDKLHEMYDRLRFLRSLFNKHPNEFDGEVGAVARAGIFDAGVTILSIYQNIDSVILGSETFMGTIKVIQTEVEEKVRTLKLNFPMTHSDKTFDDWREEIIKVPREVTTKKVTSESSIPSTDEFVGFEDESKSIMDRLTRGLKKLQVVAIVGMPGLGKTTLATKVYNEPSVQQHFHICAWCTISQDFNKRTVLLELLSQIQGSKSGHAKMTEDDLAQELRRSLLQRRYLIYIDDVWEIKAFECLRPSFPGDSLGRILLTSRIGDVAKLDDQPHFLRQLTFSESLKLLQMKASPIEGWPQSLYYIAVKIAENCKGLPLIIIIVAGLLRTTDQEVWEEVLENLTSGIISSTDQCRRTIELSYKHLPEYLKPCFLSFGGFPEDEEISVKRLIWLWIAEGFVRKTDSSSVEEVAADYLRNLIDRSLVMDSQKRNGGRIKTCRIHDLLLDFCLGKSIEGNVLHLLNGKEKVLPFEDSLNLRRLCVHGKRDDFMEAKSFFPCLRSLSFFGENRWTKVINISFNFRIFKLLRVLIMLKVGLSLYDFPGEMGNLVQLRYLSITVTHDVSPSIGNLCLLETLILDQVDGKLIRMPRTFWNLQKLRHLYSYLHMDGSHGFILPVDKVDSSCNMLELNSLAGLHSEHWGIMENHLRKFPNILRLKFWLHVFGDDIKVMSFSFLSRLESLTLSFNENSTEFEFIFPESIKQLNLTHCGLPWERISRIAELPNLEVLKLHYKCFIGDRWQMEEGEFSKLRFLKLWGLDVVNWTGWDDQFPNLEKLVVEQCSKLKEIPECLENVETLETIVVKNCSDHVAGLFQTVADYLKDRGNSVLQVHVEEDDDHDKYFLIEDDENSADGEYEDLADAEDGDSANEDGLGRTHDEDEDEEDLADAEDGDSANEDGLGRTHDEDEDLEDLADAEDGDSANEDGLGSVGCTDDEDSDSAYGEDEDSVNAEVWDLADGEDSEDSVNNYGGYA